MGFKIKNSLTGEFEKLPILTLKGEKGETGGVEEYNKVDYMGNKYETLKQANDANVEYAVKTAIGEFNYLDYDGQHITATDTMEGRSKSAILSGNTLVNLCDKTKSVYSADGNKNLWQNVLFNTNPTQLTVINHTDKVIKFTLHNRTTDNWVSTNRVEANSKSLVNCGTNNYLKDLYGAYSDGWSNTEEDINILKDGVLILEGDHTQEDIPYFEGMQSVQMPVLTTTGKNLFDMKNSNFITEKDGNYYPSSNSDLFDTYTLLPNTTYTISGIFGGWGKCFINGVSIGNFNSSGSRVTKKFTTDSTGVTTIFFGANTSNDALKLCNDFQLEIGNMFTSYEPHKSNILTVNEDVTLRGIGDVKDTLDLMTGEVVSNFETLIIDGTENWYVSSNETDLTIRYRCDNIGVSILKENICICDSYNVGGNTVGDDLVVAFGGTMLTYRVLKSKFPTLKDFKKWLNDNPHTFIYQTEKSIKTVDLSDNHVYSYKDVTHYDCSSAEGSLVPTLSVKVPTDVQATIAQQRETIQTLNSENERLNQIQEALKASMLDSQVQLMNLSWDIDFEVFTLRESIAPKDFLLASRTGSNIDKFSQAKFIIENDCPDLEKLNSQIEYYFSKDVFSQEQFEELTDLISIVKGENGCEY